MKQRIITAVVAAAVFLPIVFYGGRPFTLLVYLLGTIGVLELLRMKRIDLLSFPVFLSLVLLWAFLIPRGTDFPLTAFSDYKVEIALFAVLLLLTYTVLIKNKFTFDDAAFVMLATIYVGMGFYYFIEIRQIGLVHVFFALFIIWATDSGAYFIGRAMGKNKLWPEISPNKTVEGSLGGVICAILVAIIFQLVAPVEESIIQLLIIAVVLSIFGQVGDLVESAFKRHYGVKDSGRILPGHGGILDRFDSLLFVWPILYFLMMF
jgi:phosphatidate cytidylyltransferase